MDYKFIVRRLNVWYYSVAIMTVLVALCSYLLLSKGLIATIDPFSPVGRNLQIVFILITLSCVPFGLFYFKQQCKKIRLIEDDRQRQRAYIKAATMRILVVGMPMTVDIFAYYMLGGNQSMIWMAAVAAIGWYMTKPTERKIQLELLPDDDRY